MVWFRVGNQKGKSPLTKRQSKLCFHPMCTVRQNIEMLMIFIGPHIVFHWYYFWVPKTFVTNFRGSIANMGAPKKDLDFVYDAFSDGVKWVTYNGCSNHMTRDRKLLMEFMEVN